MSEAGRLIEIPEGTVVLSEGELNLDMYKIVKGNAEVYMGYGKPNETLIGIIGPQSCFGEFGLLLEKPSIYTVIAYSDLLLVRVTKGDIGDFVQQNHKCIIDIMKNMACTMMTMRLQIDLLVNDLAEGNKPDEKEVHDMEKTIATYTVYRNSAMSGKFHTIDRLRNR